MAAKKRRRPPGIRSWFCGAPDGQRSAPMSPGNQAVATIPGVGRDVLTGIPREGAQGRCPTDPPGGPGGRGRSLRPAGSLSTAGLVPLLPRGDRAAHAGSCRATTRPPASFTCFRTGGNGRPRGSSRYLLAASTLAGRRPRVRPDADATIPCRSLSCRGRDRCSLPSCPSRRTCCSRPCPSTSNSCCYCNRRNPSPSTRSSAPSQRLPRP